MEKLALYWTSCQDGAMLISASDLLSSNTSQPIAAFNAVTLEHAEAIATAAEQADLPVVMQLSQNAIAYHGSPEAIASAMVAVARSSSAQIVLHLDHITELNLALSAEDLGFSSVMYDGAHHDYTTNVATTRKVAQWGAERDIWVEAELGEIGGKDGPHTPGVRTDPHEAAQFVADTGVDSLAVAVGSSHAMTTKSAHLDLDLIATMVQIVEVPLVLHGSSGVPDKMLTHAAAAGMRKINIGTALNVAFTEAVQSWLDQNDGVDPRQYIGVGREAMADTCRHYLKVVAGR